MQNKLIYHQFKQTTSYKTKHSKQRAIQSYLYVKTIQNISSNKAPLTKTSSKNVLQTSSLVKTDTHVKSKYASVHKLKKTKNSNELSSIEQANKKAKKQTNKQANQQTIEAKLDKLSHASSQVQLSASEQLKQLRQSITNDLIEQEIKYQQRPRSLSLFHDLPDPVPASTKKLSPLAERAQQEKMTIHHAGGIGIRNDGKGHCTLTQNLSYIGLEGVATSGFDCGQTEMEKLYDAHMDKVLEKLGKK